MLYLKGSFGERKFSIIDVGVGLVSGHVCSKALQLITPIVVCALEFVSDYDSQYHTKYCDLMSLDWSA